MTTPAAEPDFRWGIESITFSGGTTVSVPPAAVTFLVGPNNSGKSRALQDIYRDATHPLATHPRSTLNFRTINDVRYFRGGSSQGVEEFLNRHYQKDLGDRGWVTLGGAFLREHLDGLLSSVDPRNAHHPFLIRALIAGTSLVFAQPVDVIRLHADAPQHYIHLLQTDPKLLTRISHEVKEAFGEGLVITYTGGKQVWFHFGAEPHRTREMDRVSPEYARAVEGLPPLHDQGYGIQSFVGTLLACECGAQPVLLIDEPDAFLYPPQARRLGYILARSADQLQRQIIAATHSSSIIQGALEYTSQRGGSWRKIVAVCRMTRKEDKNYCRLLDNARLDDLLKKPLLRSSAAIEGVFHDGVVVCEGDADCRFYEAILRRLKERGAIKGPIDLFFVHGGGKGQLATLASAYLSLSVPTVVIPDLDMIKTKGEFVKLLKLMGGDIGPLEGLYNSVVSGLAGLPPSVTTAQFLERLDKVHDELAASQKVETAHRKALGELLDDASDWSRVKKNGLAELTGNVRLEGGRLIDECARCGMFLLPLGELESWWRSGPGEKAEWFTKALERIDADQGSFDKAELFLRFIVRFIRGESDIKPSIIVRD